MKTFRSTMVLRCPRNELWAAMRDHLPELASQLPEIERIIELERVVETDSKVRIVNQWRVRQQIPGFASRLIGSKEIGWIDRNTWDETTATCSWSIEPSVLQEFIHCAGTTRFETAMGGQGTRVTFEGGIDLKPGLLNGSIASVERPIAGFVESIVTTVIPRNLRSVLDAAASLAANRSGHCGESPTEDRR